MSSFSSSSLSADLVIVSTCHVFRFLLLFLVRSPCLVFVVIMTVVAVCHVVVVFVVVVVVVVVVVCHVVVVVAAVGCFYHCCCFSCFCWRRLQAC